MGVVYRAEQVRPRRRVALKVLAPHLAGDAGFRERFEFEVETAAAIEHPNIIPLYHAGEADGVLYLAMRFVEGTDLGSLIAERGRLEPGRALAVVGQIAAALDVAHAQGLVHRDVKPANILVARGSVPALVEHAYLTDFGIAKQTSDPIGRTRTGLFVGTVPYAAPEQIDGKRLDGRADQYALACVLVECLTGSTPFARESEVRVMFAHLHEPPPSVHGRCPELPVALDAVIARALAKSAEDRYPSCSEFVRAARQALEAGGPATGTAAAAGAAAATTVAAGAEAAVDPSATAVATGPAVAATPAAPLRREAVEVTAPAPPRGPTPPVTPVGAPSRERRWRRRPLILAVLAALVVGGAVGGVIAATSGGDAASEAAPPPAPAAAEPASPEPAPPEPASPEPVEPPEPAPPEPVEPPAEPVEPPAEPVEPPAEPAEPPAEPVEPPAEPAEPPAEPVEPPVAPQPPPAVADGIRFAREGDTVVASVTFSGRPLGARSLVRRDIAIGDGRAVVDVRQPDISAEVDADAQEGVAVTVDEGPNRLRIVLQTEPGAFAALTARRGPNSHAVVLTLTEPAPAPAPAPATPAAPAPSPAPAPAPPDSGSVLCDNPSIPADTKRAAGCPGF
jgi:serine/threonine-protein kinase